jgi:helix-turn-helix protein
MKRTKGIRNLKANILQAAQAEFCSVDTAEAMTGISRWTWRSWAYKGRIGSCKAGRRLLLPLTEVRRILAEGYRPPVADPDVIQQ